MKGLTVFTLAALVQVSLGSLRSMRPEAIMIDDHSQRSQDCPCSSPDLCSPITTPPRKEVYAFHTSKSNETYKQYDWNIVTTICVFGDITVDLMCLAHSKGVRVTLGTSFPENQLTNQTAIDAFIKSKIATIQSVHGDGINLDIEGDTTDSTQLTMFTEQVSKAFHTQIPGSHVTFDTGVWANESSGGYNITGLSLVTDFLVVMAYDMCWGTKVGKANSPYNVVQQDMKSYTSGSHVDPSKIVLGLPWYGYIFPCTSPATNPPTPCDVEVPFGGASWQIAYSKVLSIMDTNKIGPVVMDDTQKSKYFDYNDAKGVHHQVWFDDADTLAYKYQLAKDMGLRGVGFWTADCLDYQGGKNVTEMWDAVARNFTSLL